MKHALQWSETYSVGIREIDEQHRKLFDRINAFNRRVDSHDLNAPKKMLIDLMEYALLHFSTEERYFRRFHYADTKMHIQEHQSFEQKISEYRLAYQTEKSFNASLVLNYLKRWIIDHILISDKKYMKCFHENGLT